jgi:small-conductance mechanosensitive channel/CRP-like cAMP-binding protein
MSWPSILLEEVTSRVTILAFSFIFILVLLILKKSFDQKALSRVKLTISSFLLYFGMVIVLSGIKVAGATKLYHTINILSMFVIAFAYIQTCIIVIFDIILLTRKKYEPPRIVRDLVQAFFFGAVLIMLLAKSGVNLISLLTTSAILTAVIGLALQDTLVSVISGLTLQVEKPFSVNDWVEVDGKIGILREIGWRTTRIETKDRVLISIPNSILNKALVINYSRPTELLRRTLHVSVEYAAPPNEVKDALKQAIIDVPGVLPTPEPVVQLAKFSDFYIDYRVRYFMDVTQNFTRDDSLDSDVLIRIWYALKRKNFRMPFPIRDVYLHQVTKDEIKEERYFELQERIRTLQHVDFLRPLPPEELEKLALALSVQKYAQGEMIIREGANEYTFFVIVSGSVEVNVGKEMMLVARLNPGQFFGEMSLMTGEPRKANIIAASDVVCYMIDKTPFEDIFANNSQIIADISSILAKRQQELQKISREMKPEEVILVQKEANKDLLGRIRKFFNLKG